jgi:glycosyltransferase involved in cell wall biosynthesis
VEVDLPPTTSISVALCTFNGERYLTEQLDSISCQTVLPDEVVIADDGSSDATLEIVDAWAQAFPATVVVLDEPLRQGITANFERALAATTGAISLLSDQDDVWQPDRVEQTRRILDGHTWGLVASDAPLIDGESHDLGETIHSRLGLSIAERASLATGDLFDTALRRNLATGATVAVTRALWQAARPFPSTWLHDEWLTMLAASADVALWSDDPFISYRVHNSNVVGVTRPTLRYRIDRVFEPQRERMERLASRASDLVDRWDELNELRQLVGDDVWRSRGSAVKAKAAFEAERASLPSRRLSRLATVGRLARAGQYQKFASRGRLDVLRDALHSAR